MCLNRLHTSVLTHREREREMKRFRTGVRGRGREYMMVDHLGHYGVAPTETLTLKG